MNHLSELFDDRIAEWLEDDPTDAPPQVLETVLAAMPQISQRRSAPLALPRFMASRRFAAAMAVLAIAALLLAVGAVVVGPPVSSPTPPNETTFTSPIYGYTVRYPETWTVVPGKRPIPANVLPCARCEEPDNIWVVPDEVVITIAASPLPAGATLDSWTTSVTERMPAKFNFGSCLSSQESITVAGDPGTRSLYTCPGRSDNTVLWTTLVHGGSGWHLIWTDLAGVDPAAIRPRFDTVLATFIFGTAPLATSAAVSSVTPSATSAAASTSPSPALPADLYGAWYHPAPSFMTFFPAGHPYCVDVLHTSLDCVLWHPVGQVKENGIVTLSGNVISLAMKSGYCTGVTSTYTMNLAGDSLNLTELPGGCQGGSYSLVRAGTNGAPTAPPEP